MDALAEFDIEATDEFRDDCKAMARMLAYNCVRNTFLEDLPAGDFPDSMSKDDADISVAGPKGAVPWSRVSRLSDDEMKTLMVEITNKIYTCLIMGQRVPFMPVPGYWQEPELDASFVGAARIAMKYRSSKGKRIRAR